MCDLTIPSGYVPKTLFHLTSQPTLGMSSTSLSKTLPCIPALQQHRQQYDMLKNTDPNIDKRLVSTLTFATSPQRNKSYLNLIYDLNNNLSPIVKHVALPLPLFLDRFGSTSFRFVLQKVQDLVHNSDSNPLSIFHRTATTWT